MILLLLFSSLFPIHLVFSDESQAKELNVFLTKNVAFIPGENFSGSNSLLIDRPGSRRLNGPCISVGYQVKQICFLPSKHCLMGYMGNVTIFHIN